MISLKMTATIAIFAATVGCSFDTRSQSFECQNDGDCESWQRCRDNLCVVAGNSCHPDCDECSNGLCIMNCEDGGCAQRVVCPPSQNCRVLCTGPGACAGGVDCRNANRCTVSCLSADTCGGSIDCGSSDCTVACLAGGSCAGGVDCSNACACDTNCSPGNVGRTCVPECPNGNSCSAGPNCTSEGAGCDTCET